MPKAVKNKEAELSFRVKADTIVCPECGEEFVVYRVNRYKDEYGDENIEVWPQSFFDYCPECGKRMDYKAWAWKRIVSLFGA